MSAVIRIGFFLVVVFVQSVAWAASPGYDNLYIFGDSLSDTGNDLVLTKAQRISPAIPPSESPHRTYYKGHFSNGTVAVEYLWQLIQKDKKASLTPFLSKKGLILKGAINFAFGGSTSGYLSQTPGNFYVPGVLGQVDMFRAALLRQQAPAHTLYFIWTGANDYLPPPPALPAQPAEVVANITRAVEILYSLGARDFMIPNLPDLGIAPLAAEHSNELSQLTVAHNSLLKEARDDLAARLYGVNIIFVDMFAATRNMLDGSYNPKLPAFVAFPPALALISPGTGAVDCLFRNPTTCPDVNLTAPAADQLFFWDVLHPTTAAHAQMAKEMFDALPK